MVLTKFLHNHGFIIVWFCGGVNIDFQVEKISDTPDFAEMASFSQVIQFWV